MRRNPLLLIALLAAACGKGAAHGPSVTYPGIEGHSAMFLLAGTPHDPTHPVASVSPPPVTACTDCHVDPNTFAVFDCIHCHVKSQTDAIHLGNVTAYPASPANQDCYGCHRNGLGISLVNHALKFPIGTASHPAVCTDCHSDPLQRANLATLQCAVCHATRPTFPAAHAAVADFPAAPAATDCLACHADGQVDRVSAHQASFPIAIGSGSHDTVCLHCHLQKRTDKTYAVDFAGSYDCVACHTNTAASTAILVNTDQQHGGLTGYQYASTACYGCHPDGTGAPANHTPAFFPIGAGTAHASVSCTQCHTDLAHPNVPANFACATCHTSATGPTPNLITDHTTNTSNTSVRVPSSELSTTDSTTCLRCHADSQVNLTSSHPRGTTGDPPHQGAVCLQCHDVYRTDKPYGIDFATDPAAPAKCGPVLGSCSVKQGCYECHTSSPPQGN